MVARFEKMNNSENKDICQISYEKALEKLNNTLFENLILADYDEQLEKIAKEKYKRGVEFAKKALKICRQTALQAD